MRAFFGRFGVDGVTWTGSRVTVISSSGLITAADFFAFVAVEVTKSSLRRRRSMKWNS